MSHPSLNVNIMPIQRPRMVDPIWHSVDLARNEDADLAILEQENKERFKKFKTNYSDIPPIGRSSQEPMDDDEDEDDDDDDNDDNDDNDSDSHEDEEDAEMDLNFSAGNVPANVGQGSSGEASGINSPRNSNRVPQEDIEDMNP
ncbi:anaphase-promoting complex subunit 15B-like [Tigriopus californicus]|uniref:anaphase-promoting complex subunit 15B-like n=1 Tax=Tigriopus californicus TaxID=6832 RepID=UPI0027DA69CC|nr:anaphase-promoting complex subunit 15B-like [Tigriopus californicus]